MTIADIQTAARQEGGRHGLDLIVIDCLRQIQLPDRKSAWKKGNEPIVKALKGRAAELGATVVLTSQLDTRTLETRPGHLPVLEICPSSASPPKLRTSWFSCTVRMSTPK